MFTHRYRLQVIAIGCALAALVDWGVASAVAAPHFTVSSSNSTPSAGDIFTVTVSTDGLPANCVGLQVKLQFNSPTGILEYLGLDPAGVAGTGCPSASTVTYPTGGGGTHFQPLTDGNVAIFSATTSGGGNYITGSGCMVAFRFQVDTTPVPAPGASSVLTLIAGSNVTDNTPVVTEADLSGTSSITVSVPFPVSGHVTYWKCGVASRGVPFTHVTLDQPTIGTVQGSDISRGAPNANIGFFSIPGLAGQPAFLTPARNDAATDFDDTHDTDVRAAITSTDVALVVGFCMAPGLFPLTDCPISDASHCGSPTVYPQKIAADVDGSAGITQNDASVLLAIIANGMSSANAFPAAYPIAHNWVFRCAQASLGSLTGSAGTYDPTAILLGDVNGGYSDTAARSRKVMAGTVLTIPELRSGGSRITVPVELKEAHGILGLQARIVYDPSVLRFVEATTPTENPHIQTWGMGGGDGVVALVVIGLAQRIEGTTRVALLTFDRVAPDVRRAYSPLLISRASADDEDLPVHNGLFASPGMDVQDASWGSVKHLYR